MTHSHDSDSTDEVSPDLGVQRVRPAHRSCRAALLIAFVSSAPWACSPVSLLSSSFNGYPTGAAPEATPPPSPPDDSFLWPSTHVARMVVNRPGGGGWVHVTPAPSYLTDPGMRRPVMYGYTHAISQSPPASLRGAATVRLDGPGRVFLGLQAVNSQNAPGSFLGGMLVDVAPLTAARGTVLAVQPFNQARIQDVFSLPGAGQIESYAPGSVVTVRWSIDQSSRTLNMTTASPGSTLQSVQYPAAADGMSNNPIAKLLLTLWLQEVGPGTNVFVDDLVAEEVH